MSKSFTHKPMIIGGSFWQKKNVFLVMLQIAFFLCSPIRSAAQQKEEITIVITDSGLGGLSVMEDVDKKIKVSGCYKKVNLIFVNALFDSNSGYNALPTRQEKISIFSKVLTGIDQRFKPDVILVACNTLSVLYRETDFAKKSGTTIYGILEPGVQLVAERLLSDSTASVILFGTETTIEEASHRKALLALNIADKRIVAKSCPQLQSYIEQDPHSEETGMLISVYLNEALEQLPKTVGTLFLSLNCSHFGYSEDLWEKAFASTPFKFGGILDPNFRMADYLIEEKYRNKFAKTTLTYLVVSKIELLNVKAMVQFFTRKAPDLANALQNYQLMPALFK